MKSRGIVNLPVRSLIPHPENPRKDLGDLTEMSESIKKNGVLQNLTVIPKDIDGNDCNCNNAFKYMVIIGHRRLAAAEAAGVDQVPCRIVEGMTHDEQLLTMLEENMQRSDLTIYDQAQGFQMMLDLGQTVEDIEEKSGFSKTTIYHRLNIAKLDKETLKAKQDSDSFQLNITDLIELEKVKNVEKRNHILKTARNSSELKYLASSTAKEEDKNEKIGKIIAILEALGIKELPKEVNYWSCNKRYNIPVEEYGNVEIDVVEGEELYYRQDWNGVSVYELPEEKSNDDSEDEDVHVDSKWDKFQKAKSDITEAYQRLKEARKDTLADIILGKLEPENKETAGRALWQCVMEIEAAIDMGEMADKWLELQGIEPEDPDEADDAWKQARIDIFEMPFEKQCALILFNEYLPEPISIYSASLNEEAIEFYKVMDKALQNYGFKPSALDEDLLSEDGELLRVLKKRKEEYNS